MCVNLLENYCVLIHLKGGTYGMYLTTWLTFSWLNKTIFRRDREQSLKELDKQLPRRRAICELARFIRLVAESGRGTILPQTRFVRSRKWLLRRDWVRQIKTWRSDAKINLAARSRKLFEIKTSTGAESNWVHARLMCSSVTKLKFELTGSKCVRPGARFVSCCLHHSASYLLRSNRCVLIIYWDWLTSSLSVQLFICLCILVVSSIFYVQYRSLAAAGTLIVFLTQQSLLSEPFAPTWVKAKWV